jgi:hypothetical protein
MPSLSNSRPGGPVSRRPLASAVSTSLGAVPGSSPGPAAPTRWPPTTAPPPRCSMARRGRRRPGRRRPPELAAWHAAALAERTRPPGRPRRRCGSTSASPTASPTPAFARPRPTCWPSTRSRPPTTPSCGPPQPAGTSQPRDRPAHRRGGVFPNDAAPLRLAGSLLIEQNDEWLVSRRYLSEASMAELTAEPTPTTERELQAA